MLLAETTHISVKSVPLLLLNMIPSILPPSFETVVFTARPHAPLLFLQAWNCIHGSVRIGNYTWKAGGSQCAQIPWHITYHLSLSYGPGEWYSFPAWHPCGEFLFCIVIQVLLLLAPTLELLMVGCNPVLPSPSFFELERSKELTYLLLALHILSSFLPLHLLLCCCWLLENIFPQRGWCWWRLKEESS